MIIPKEADKENDKNTDDGTVYRQILIVAKFSTGKRGHTAELSPLTLRLLMSYIYGAPSKARNANVVFIYGPTFGNAETVSFYLLHNVSTLNQCREVSCVTFVCKHFAS